MWRLNFSASGREKQLYLENMCTEEREILTAWAITDVSRRILLRRVG
jgi:hypothetical protein